MPDATAPVRALLIAHLPSRSISAVLQQLQADGFQLAPEELPDKVSWASTAYGHSFLMAWFIGPRAELKKWEAVAGVLGFTEDDGLGW